MQIGAYPYEDYRRRAEAFHGRLAPGLLIGGFLVDLTLQRLPSREDFAALCETEACLPDAVQLLTPCTAGNGRLKVLGFGRFAVSLYGRDDGVGVRAYLDMDRLKAWPEIQQWAL
jgi:formylmethanofuran dehydrogenase subunit E